MASTIIANKGSGHVYQIKLNNIMVYIVLLVVLVFVILPNLDFRKSDLLLIELLRHSSYCKATTSTSTIAPFGSSLTAMQERAGYGFVKYSA